MALICKLVKKKKTFINNFTKFPNVRDLII